MNNICETCNKHFTTKGNLSQHKKKKIRCIKSIETALTCKKCKYTFSNNANLKKHLLTSKCANTEDKFKKLEEKNQKLEEMIEELKQMIHLGIMPVVTPVTNNIINNTTNTHITVNMYGKEDTSYITGKKLETILNKCFKSVLMYIGEKHFSKDHPENSNICITDIKNNYILYYDGDKWIITDRKDMIDTLYTKNCDELQDLFDDMREKLDEKIIDKFNRFLDQQDDDEIQQKIKDDIKYMLYNERNMALHNKSQCKFISNK